MPEHRGGSLPQAPGFAICLTVQDTGTLGDMPRPVCLTLLHTSLRTTISLAVCVTGCLMACLTACSVQPWNDPHARTDRGDAQNVLYAAFAQRPKHLDPARSYSSDEYRFIGQIYEPPLQYHYLHRPYRLEPLSAASMPVVRHYDANGDEVAADSAQLTYTDYEITIRKGMRYQPHPALARKADGSLRYVGLRSSDLEGINRLADFGFEGSREVVASDYVYQIKRLAHPATHSPILGLMRQYILGLGALSQELQAAEMAHSAPGPGLDERELSGVTVLGRYRYRIRIKGSYPQFVYWLAMPFFSPVPPEVDAFYAQPGMKQRNLSLDWYPLGSGPYRLEENNPNRQMVLARNPLYHGDVYPGSGTVADQAEGLLVDAGQPLPMIDRAVYSLEKENIPYWSKFLQGWYDASTVSSDSFDQAVQMAVDGGFGLTDEMREKGIRLETAVATSIWYFGFNWLDTVVGGNSERARKLRLAISIALDYEEFVQIFQNGRGVAAQGPLPPGIGGRHEGKSGINPQVYRWQDGKPLRRSVDEARALLKEAGYANGIDPGTGKPLVLYFDTYSASGADARARLDWYRKQFRKLGIRLVVRATDYNRFRDKMSKGNAQMFSWGWNADYPDAENFLFLLTSAQSKVAHQGENASNYSNPRFDALFDRMKNMADGPQRQRIIDKMLGLLRQDAPWAWGYHPVDFSLHHAWLKNVKPNLMAHNTLKYQRLDPSLRAHSRRLWNAPRLLPLYGIAVVIALMLVPVWRVWRRREQRKAIEQVGP